MVRRPVFYCIRLMVILFSGFSAVNAQSEKKLQSPDEFLGYTVGTRYTPHWKIVQYYQQVAAAVPSMIKLEKYGETNEGRPLMLAYVSTPENMRNLEQVRMNNLRLANLAKDKAAPIEENAPAIVWLSYNVHGNETSSSEAALLTLYALVNPAETKTKEWLKNTVVIIDPCINPDGRDRYVNWFNSIAGKYTNPLRYAREHREPWPGGRTNHYNFDLNRDWAWQTQTESRQRIKVYQQWMPQVHVDYHEQGADAPYYFAPAAQPYHDVITGWQRDFQVLIGKNHAKYFDSNGWLYFTKEIFDLYYPSYGDTYPTYNGAIGMTYEQGGGPSGGTAVLKSDGDTLTLLDRVTHHYTTSLSTIEVSSVNAARLIREFRKYFNNALANGTGEYKSFIVKNDPDNRERIASLLQLLDKNGIEYSAVSGAAKGFNYNTGKEESITMNNDILISSLQPRSSMVKVLFEPRGKLVDSVTYDITAWALPYAYGLNAWASKDKIARGGAVPANKITNEETSYGYVIPWKGVQSVKLVGQLLRKGIVLRYAEQPFEVNGQAFDRGSVIVLKAANKSFGNGLFAQVRKAADDAGVQLYPVTTGYVDKGNDFGSEKVHAFKAPRVVVLTGDGVNSNAAGEVWHFFDQQLEYPVTLTNVADIVRIAWDETDVLVMPDGNYRFLTDKAQLDQLKGWINKGGRVVALEGAVNGLAKTDIGIRSKKADDDEKGDDYSMLVKFEERDRSAVSGGTPGSIFKAELDNTHPLAYGYPAWYYTLKMDDKVYEFFKEGSGWNVGVIKKDNQVAGFVGAKLKDKLKDGLLFGAQQMGNGTVIYLVDDLLFRNFWENGKLMFCNAVFLTGN